MKKLLFLLLPLLVLGCGNLKEALQNSETEQFNTNSKLVKANEKIALLETDIKKLKEDELKYQETIQSQSQELEFQLTAAIKCGKLTDSLRQELTDKKTKLSSVIPLFYSMQDEWQFTENNYNPSTLNHPFRTEELKLRDYHILTFEKLKLIFQRLDLDFTFKPDSSFRIIPPLIKKNKGGINKEK